MDDCRFVKPEILRKLRMTTLLRVTIAGSGDTGEEPHEKTLGGGFDGSTD
jgi:hypothetical protein